MLTVHIRRFSSKENDMIDEDVIHKVEIRGWKLRSVTTVLCDRKGAEGYTK